MVKNCSTNILLISLSTPQSYLAITKPSCLHSDGFQNTFSSHSYEFKISLFLHSEKLLLYLNGLPKNLDAPHTILHQKPALLMMDPSPANSTTLPDKHPTTQGPYNFWSYRQHVEHPHSIPVMFC